MKPRYAIFLPVRSGSRRITDKNTRPFCNFSNGLLELKMTQLIRTDCLDEIIVSTNDQRCIEVAETFLSQSNKIKIVQRPDHLCTDQTSLTDLVRYVTLLTECEHIIWTHVTSPFFNEEDYSGAVHAYESALTAGYDSLMSVYPFLNFLWSDEHRDLWNRMNNEKWPRTQDLKKLYEIDSAVFIASREVYLKYSDRIGIHPFLFENDKIKSMDIDWETDFFIAEAVYEKLFLR